MSRSQVQLSCCLCQVEEVSELSVSGDSFLFRDRLCGTSGSIVLFLDNRHQPSHPSGPPWGLQRGPVLSELGVPGGWSSDAETRLWLPVPGSFLGVLMETVARGSNHPPFLLTPGEKSLHWNLTTELHFLSRY